MHRHVFLFPLVLLLTSLKAASQQRLPLLPDTANRPVSLRVVPQNFYKQNLSFFCRQELSIQKATSLPLYFRLGSKGYVDYLEGKPNAVKTQ